MIFKTEPDYCVPALIAFWGRERSLIFLFSGLWLWRQITVLDHSDSELQKPTRKQVPCSILMNRKRGQKKTLKWILEEIVILFSRGAVLDFSEIPEWQHFHYECSSLKTDSNHACPPLVQGHTTHQRHEKRSKAMWRTHSSQYSSFYELCRVRLVFFIWTTTAHGFLPHDPQIEHLSAFSQLHMCTSRNTQLIIFHCYLSMRWSQESTIFSGTMWIEKSSLQM